MLRLISSVITGAVIGWIAGKLMNDDRTSWIKNILIGIIGSGLGSALFGLIGFSAHGLIANGIVSIVGACLLIWLGRKFFGNG